MPSLIITTIRVIGVAGPLAYYFTFIQNKPVEWIWYSMFISGIFATIISIVWVTITFKKLSIAQVKINVMSIVDKNKIEEELNNWQKSL